jgi:signal transduction histidine kinase
MSSLIQPVKRLVSYQWQGPAKLAPGLRLEWRFIAVRWLGIVMVAFGLPLARLADDRLLAAYGLLVIAVLYNLILQRVMPRWPTLFTSGYLTTMGDTLFNIAMVNVGGGFSSPFYFLLFTVTISAAMRYGYGPALLTALMFIGFDGAEHFSQGLPLDAPIVFRSGFLVLTAILAGYLREQAQRAESALEERLRQASLLNEATAALGASLELERVLEAVLAGASRLFDSACVVLYPSPSLNEAVQVGGPMPYNLDGRDDLRSALEALAQNHPAEDATQVDGRQDFHSEVLASGQQAVVVTVGVPSRQTSLATLAIASVDGTALPDLDDDILNSFGDRVMLAIENTSLYRRLTHRSADLQRAYADLASAHQELVRVDEMKTNFLANVSHEFRTPLTSIRSFSELLLTYEEKAHVQREFLSIINAETERLTRMVNDVLDITKIESGSMEWQMQMLDLAELLHEVARMQEPLAHQQNLAFKYDIDTVLPRVYADRDRLQQVVSNLINNALKFTENGAITLTARVVRSEVHIAVSDTGIGVAQTDQERIFGKFQQVGATLTDKPRGTGLGLSICREIVEHHEGRIWLESQPGRGSTFTVALPLSAAIVSAPAFSAPAAELVPA